MKLLFGGVQRRARAWDSFSKHLVPRACSGKTTCIPWYRLHIPIQPLSRLAESVADSGPMSRSRSLRLMFWRVAEHLGGVALSPKGSTHLRGLLSVYAKALIAAPTPIRSAVANLPSCGA